MATAIQKNLVDKNGEFSSKFGGLANLPKAPSKHYIVVTCMDSRIDPVPAFGIGPGEAHVVRNAGGSAVDALRSVLISHHLLGTVEVLVVKHTGCGMLTFDNPAGRAAVASSLGAACGPKQKDDLEKIDLLPFADLEASVRDDVEFLKGCGLLKEGTTVSGWTYDVGTGKVKHIA